MRHTSTPVSIHKENFLNKDILFSIKQLFYYISILSHNNIDAYERASTTRELSLTSQQTHHSEPKRKTQMLLHIYRNNIIAQ